MHIQISFCTKCKLGIIRRPLPWSPRCRLDRDRVESLRHCTWLAEVLLDARLLPRFKVWRAEREWIDILKFSFTKTAGLRSMEIGRKAPCYFFCRPQPTPESLVRAPLKFQSSAVTDSPFKFTVTQANEWSPKTKTMWQRKQNVEN